MAGRKIMLIAERPAAQMIDDLKRKTSRTEDAQVLRDALRIYCAVIREYEAGNDPLRLFSETSSEETRALDSNVLAFLRRPKP